MYHSNIDYQYQNQSYSNTFCMIVSLKSRGKKALNMYHTMYHTVSKNVS